MTATPKPHWGQNRELVRRLKSVADGYGLGGQVLEILGVERLRDYTGDFDTALRDISDAGLATLNAFIERQTTTPTEHSEAMAVAWCNVNLQNGTQISVTARQGATAGDIVATTTALIVALEKLNDAGVIK